MKKAIKTILGCVCVASVILAGGETPEGGISLIWTIGFLATAVLSGLAWGKLDDERNSIN